MNSRSTTIIFESKISILYIVSFLLLFSTVAQQATIDPSPGPRDSPCLAAYGDKIYVFGGAGDDVRHSWFSYVQAPFNTQSLKWVALPTTGAHNVSSRPACGVTSAGILLVTGGGSDDANYQGIQAFDLTKGTSGQWYTPKTSNLDTVKYLTYVNSHRLVIFKTSFGDEVLFQFGGSPANDTYLLHIGNMTWETIPKGSTTPPPNGLFGIGYSKDNVYIVGGSSDFNGGVFAAVWGFNVPTRQWFDPQATMSTGWFDGHLGKLNDTFYITSSSSDTLKSSMRVWTLSNNSFYTYVNGSMSTLSHEYYASTQLPGCDALVTYGGSTINSSAQGDTNYYMGNTADLLIFNMTQKAWVTTYNYVTNAPMDKFVGGPLAPNQADPFLVKSSSTSTANPSGTSKTAQSGSSDGDNPAKSSSSIIYIGIAVAVIILLVIGVCIDVDPNLQLYPSKYDSASDKTYDSPNAILYSNSLNSSSVTLTAQSGAPHSMRMHAPLPGSRLKDEIFGRHKVAAMIYNQPDVVLAEPSAPSGTVILQRYRLSGNSSYGGNNMIRQAVDEQTDDQVAIKFFQKSESFEREVVMLKYLRSHHVGELLALYEFQPKQNWPYAVILDYYPQSMDKLILTKLSNMDVLYVKLLIKSITQAVHYLHTHKIAHLDIKPSNFVHEKSDITSWRLVDFEAARFAGEELVDDCSPLYCSPEVLNAAKTNQPIVASTSMDVWSLGCMIFELYTHTPLFYSEEEANDKLTKSFAKGELVDFPLNKISDPQARNMLEKMLAVNPSKRISCEQILRSALLNSGLDTKQLSSLQNESTNKIITAVNQNTNTILSTLQETTNLILSQIDAVMNSITDTMDASIPRLYILLPGQDSHSIFKPHTWGRNTFVLHLLCEGLKYDNRGAHCTSHEGYEIHDPKPLLAKAGPYLSIMATVITAGVSTRPTEYFKQLTQVLDSEITDTTHARDIERVKNDPIGRMKVVQGAALRELEAFLKENDKSMELGGLTRVVMKDGRWRWVCGDCYKQANSENHYI
ncbi:17060_t:CDS:2 [Acaulospora morrowiae]|uniref:17060_t:CDS:1 n=1 Tax=Acaulospora morrowiae TaxID=94023 RepID=A0A9N9EZR6_9GLOM|nr:17060_t:CDS:2 [Acaulospora morrowiae]